ncbi:MAG: Ldh family oxidoreductase [Cytophagales bacterium]|nr:Ldh family oxidoreductase [Cytophagales bacterium]
MARIHLAELTALVVARLAQAGANEAMAKSTAKALVLAEAQGLGSHGLSRVAQYVTHLNNGRANGAAIPFVLKRKGGSLLVDAQEGLAFPACDLAIQEALQATKTNGVTFAGVVRSHHCGVLVDHLRAVAEAGMVGIGFANSPAAMPAAGGRHAIFGTNPIAAIFPRRGHAPLMIDLSLSQVARGKLMVAAKAGSAIPEGWALDAQGHPTTDPHAGLAGSMLPFGSQSGSQSGTQSGASPKGAMLALMVELLVSALIGAHFGYEASSFFVDEGNRPGLGQAFMVIDPAALAGQDQFLDRVEMLVAQMLQDEGVRLPGARREALKLRAEAEGIDVADAFLADAHR